MANDLPDPRPGTLVLENEKFALNGNGKVVVRVEDETAAATGSLLQGIQYDAGSVAYPNNTTEVYSFFTGGLAGTLVATITLTYNASDKAELNTFAVSLP